MSAPKFLSTGRCLPAKIVTNDDLSRTVDTNDEWVFSRTGIHARHFCERESGMDLARGAARQALERSGLKAEDIGVCLVATFTPDFASPSMACMLQKQLGLKEDTICFDLNAACAGFLYGTKTAHALLADAPRPYAIVVGAEVISRVLDHTDRNTCVLFGDGAGAAVLARDDSARWHTVFGSRGDEQSIWVQGPGPEKAAVHMEGKAVFRFATEVVEGSIRQLVSADGCAQAQKAAIMATARSRARIFFMFCSSLSNFVPNLFVSQVFACHGPIKACGGTKINPANSRADIFGTVDKTASAVRGAAADRFALFRRFPRLSFCFFIPATAILFVIFRFCAARTAAGADSRACRIPHSAHKMFEIFRPVFENFRK